MTPQELFEEGWRTYSLPGESPLVDSVEILRLRREHRKWLLYGAEGIMAVTEKRWEELRRLEGDRR